MFISLQMSARAQKMVDVGFYVAKKQGACFNLLKCITVNILKVNIYIYGFFQFQVSVFNFQSEFPTVTGAEPKVGGAILIFDFWH
jgi:hypothetical protein